MENFLDNIDYLSIKNRFIISNVGNEFDVISHYTSVSSFMKILEGENIRLSSTNYLNDPEDSVLFLNAYRDFLNSYAVDGGFGYVLSKDFWGCEIEWGLETDKFNDKFNNDKVGLYIYFMLMALDFFYGKNFWDYINDYSDDEVVFVASFVGGDSGDGALPLWQAYANDGTGIRIDYDLTALQDFLSKTRKYMYKIKPVTYLSKNKTLDFIQSISKFYIDFLNKNVNTVDDLFDFVKYTRKEIGSISAFIKSEYYHHENEIRIVMDGFFVNIQNDDAFFERNDLIVSFVTVPILNNFIVNILCGPASDLRLVRSVEDYIRSSKIRNTFGELEFYVNDEMSYGDGADFYDYYRENFDHRWTRVPSVRRSNIKYQGKRK